MKTSILCLLIILTCGSSNLNKEYIDQEYENVSLINLISTPDKYHNKLIRVRGYAKFEKEGEAVYLSKDDYEYFLPKNALALSINYKQLIDMEISYASQGYAIIKGVFDKNRLGHFDLFSGSIKNIEYIDWLEKREE